MKLHRLDPPGCGCTDCMTGYSKPVDEATDDELWQLMSGVLDNASGNDLEEVEAVGDKARAEAILEALRWRL